MIMAVVVVAGLEGCPVVSWPCPGLTWLRGLELLIQWRGSLAHRARETTPILVLCVPGVRRSPVGRRTSQGSCPDGTATRRLLLWYLMCRLFGVILFN